MTPPINSSAVVAAVVASTKSAFALWKSTAFFHDIRINGPVALGLPGCLSGPDFTGLINARLGVLRGDDLAVAKAAAAGIGRNFTAYQNGITVPGLPWYPTFAAFPGPVASPTPNIPTPLISLPSGGFPGIAVGTQLKSAMEQAAGTAIKAKAGTVFADVAVVLSAFFPQAISTTFVSRVMGTGSVPGYAPPMVPVGPVVNGNVLVTPGHLA